MVDIVPLTEQKHEPVVLLPALDTFHLLEIERNNAIGKK